MIWKHLHYLNNNMYTIYIMKTYRKYRGGRTPRSTRRSSGRKSGRRSGRRSSGRRSSSKKSPVSPWIEKRRTKRRTSPKISPIFKKRMKKTQAVKDEKRKYFTAQSKIMANVDKKRKSGKVRSPRALRAEHAKIAKMPGISSRMAEISKKLAEGNYLD